MNKRFKKVLFMTAIVSVTMVACNDDDEDSTVQPSNTNTTARVEVVNQVSNRNTITVKEIYMPENGFAVIHRDNGAGGPLTPGIISDTAVLKAGLNTNVTLTIRESISTDDKVWVMTHTDDNDDGVYNFPDTDANGDFIDGPLVVNGNVLMTSLTVTAPSITDAGEVITNNQITIDRVEAAVDGWLVLHYFSAAGLGGAVQVEPIAGKAKVTAGVNTDVVVELNADSTYNTGRVLFPMLHVDGDGNDTYDFPGGTSMDVPEIFSNAAFPSNVIFIQVTAK